MSWPWLTGTVVLLFMFIVSVLSVPPTIADNWQLVRSAVRRVRRPKSPAPSALIAASRDEAIAKTPAQTPPYLGRAPRYITRPGYQHSGGAASTASVMDLDGYMESMTSQVARTTLRWPATPTFPFSSATSNAAGTATTA